MSELKPIGEIVREVFPLNPGEPCVCDADPRPYVHIKPLPLDLLTPKEPRP